MTRRLFFSKSDFGEVGSKMGKRKSGKEEKRRSINQFDLVDKIDTIYMHQSISHSKKWLGEKGAASCSFTPPRRELARIWPCSRQRPDWTFAVCMQSGTSEENN